MKRLAFLLAAELGLALIMGGCSKKEEEKPAEEKAAAAEQLPLKEVLEVEPNQKTDQAMEIKEACVVNASLEAASEPKKGPVDWYQIVPGRKRVVKIQVSGIPEEDLRLVILDADKNKLFEVDSGGKGEGEIFPNLTVERGGYLEVEGAAGSKGGAYRLTVNLADPAAGEEIEPNDRYSTANQLAAGERVSGYLGHRHDEDWYLLSLKDLPTGSVLRMDLTDLEGVRSRLEVLDYQARTPILEVSSPEVGKGMVVRNLGVPGTPEAVYVVVKSAWVPGPLPKKYVRTFNPNAGYSLSVSSEAGGDDLEQEPDDDAKHARLLLDGQRIRGYLSSPNDVDWYKIEVERPSLLSVGLSGLERVDLQLYVVDPQKKDQPKNFELVRINDGAVNEEEVLTNCALQPGENYVRVEGAWKNVDGKWVRDFMNLDETYSLTLSLRTDEGREEREPNDQAEQGNPIEVGGSLRGTLHPKRDLDYYRLDLSGQDGPRNTVIECTGIPKVDIALALLGPERDDRGKPRQTASSDRGKGEDKERIEKELMPGEYHILVRGSPATESNTRDQYLLTVTQP